MDRSMTLIVVMSVAAVLVLVGAAVWFARRRASLWTRRGRPVAAPPSLSPPAGFPALRSVRIIRADPSGRPGGGDASTVVSIENVSSAIDQTAPTAQEGALMSGVLGRTATTSASGRRRSPG